MDQSELPVYILGYIIAFIIAIFVTRAVFSIPKFLKLQEAKLQILAEIAKQQGVKSEILTSIHVNCGVNERLKTDAENRDELNKSRTRADKVLENEALSHPKE